MDRAALLALVPLVEARATNRGSTLHGPPHRRCAEAGRVMIEGGRNLQGTSLTSKRVLDEGFTLRRRS